MDSRDRLGIMPRYNPGCKVRHNLGEAHPCLTRKYIP